jgi:hypothetical protein
MDEIEQEIGGHSDAPESWRDPVAGAIAINGDQKFAGHRSLLNSINPTNVATIVTSADVGRAPFRYPRIRANKSFRAE